MLDVKIFRDQPEIARESEKKRFRTAENVDKVIEYDKKWREALQKLQDLRAERNSLSKQFSQAIKNKSGEIEQLKMRSTEIKDEIARLEPETESLIKLRDVYRYKVGNLIGPNVPIAQNDEGNQIIRKHGKILKFEFEPKNHVALVDTVKGVELNKASAIAGSRFYYLKNDLVLLNLALIQFALDALINSGFQPFWTPFMLKHDIMAEVAEISDFQEQLYKIEGDDLYLIATSEQTLAALHYDEIIDKSTLPRKYCGVSTCFRREAGSHGKDTLGIFRVHQFEKVEQFVFCAPEDSWKWHDDLIKNTEHIYQQLKLPYRIISIASGSLNDNAAAKYDLEAYFPGSGVYRELVSCSNCTDYQARKMNIRSGILGDKESFEFVHTLNSTAIATERTICCILENYQQADGTVKVPEVLVPYMHGKKIMGL